jgi:gamma-glutamylcyclotransferase (GGCT)/AIG2-like uncharacterized protein YtfP
VLYFAYGSNLDRTDLDRWSAARELPPIALEPVGPAFLPDRKLAFSHRSTTRGGGVLDVPPSIGSAVAGVIFRPAGSAAQQALDRKEGEGHLYRRVETVALTGDGASHAVVTYEVVPSERSPFVSPAAGYLEIVRRGYAAHGIDVTPLNAAAAGRPHAGPVASLFVYGTLRRGEERFPVLERHRARLAFTGSTRGTLYDLGTHPGLRLGEGSTAVIGEAYACDAIDDLLRETDAIEEFLGFGVPGSLYRRAIVTVAVTSGGSALAWAYGFEGSPAGPIVVGGDWRKRQHVP